jgi:RNA polymerase sigma-70 factor (ECF subfamily)
MSTSAVRADSPIPTVDRTRRLERIFNQNYRLVWRVVRQLGLSRDAADDAAQQVFLIAGERLEDIAPQSERAFVFGTALRVARTVNRKLARELCCARVDRNVSPLPHPDELADQKRARELLDKAIAHMPLEERTVFVLFELEGFTTLEVADVMEIPVGTAASRLRRAREKFHKQVRVLAGTKVIARGPARRPTPRPYAPLATRRTPLLREASALVAQ